ncbi:MAG: CDP-alcohol phosphatidyltransferase family protein [Proteobacteria bacterium]|nr:CDP-alcohol phosphatidyltransferase family protein [Pseudomonadota bacterium]MBU1716488.1 CDP-alcohol phosphatidyltransferase family protein [Pseudomonadota bacterium]
MNIPNFITLVRILLIPVLVILLLEGKNDLALITFIIAGASDALDGFIARLFKQKTAIGAFIDPIADKLLLITSYITLAIFGKLPGWLAVIVVSRDVIIVTGIGILMLNNRPLEIKPTIDSKVTTFVQLLTILFLLGKDYLGEINMIQTPLFYGTALITLYSGGHYLAIGIKILSNNDIKSATD